MFLHKNIVDEAEAYRLEENYIRDHFDKLTNLKIEAKPPSPKGKPGSFKGKKHSEESKRKTSLALKGRKRGPAPHAERIRLQAMAFKSGKDHPGYSKPALNRKAILETTTDTVYSDQITASKMLGIRQGDIANCLAGRQKSVKGFQFKYAK